jgi:hypothetical protein
VANSATLGSVLDRAAPLADMVPFAALTFVKRADASQWANDALMKMHYLFCNSGQEYFKSFQDYTLIGGTDQYDLPTDIHKPLGADEITSSGYRWRLGRYGWQERDKYQGAVGESSVAWSQYEYLVIGQKLELIPKPSTGTIRLYYIPQYTKLVNDTDPVSQFIFEGWEQYAVLHVAINARDKQEVDYSQLAAERDQLWQMFVDFLAPRDAGEPKHVVDVYGRFNRRSRLVR